MSAVDVRDVDEVLRWRRVKVDGRDAVYGEGGPPGPPLVFLHGWALGSHAYKRAIRRLTRRGCRVYAPAMPSFGGTADLPRSRADIAAYAAWVASFMDAVGIDEPALVVGHSFGGGVATKVAHDFPDRVSYLILLNAVGGVEARPPWAWAAGFAREMWPPRQALETVEAMRDDLLPNMIRNPLGLVRAGLLARDADLRDDLARLRGRGLPVLALTSDDDGVIPRTGFDVVCDAVGADSTVVRGRHCWLLADPDAFDAVLASVVDLQVDAHRSSAATGRAADVAALLESRMPRRHVKALMRDAAPLWLLSDGAAALATDLALCHPTLRADEIRAVATLTDDPRVIRLTVATRDRPGLLADSAAVLTTNRLSIQHASAGTWAGRMLAVHSFTVRARDSDTDWEGLGADLRSMVSVGVKPPAFVPSGPVVVTVDGEAGDRSVVRVRARDQLGLLAAIFRFFADHGLNVETVHARTAGGIASDQFIVAGSCDAEALRMWLSPTN